MDSQLYPIYRLQMSTQKEIKLHISGGQIERVGATIDPNRRCKEYERKGYRGTMYYAPTTNMKKAENSLLNACETCSQNIQKASNVDEEPGYVYAITKRPSDNYCTIL